jgi:peroxiredoxin Q/BCP
MKVHVLAAMAAAVLAGWGWLWPSGGRAETAFPVRVGQAAPDFTLNDQYGMPVTLSEFRGDQTVVLYFYPKDDTPGCTKQACSFRDDLARFQALNARVLGVSVDGLDAHRTFAEKYKLTFPILSDEDHRVSRAYGVLSGFAGFTFAKRTTFVIDPNGVIRRIFTDVDPNDHATELLQYLKSASDSASAPKAPEG